MQSSEVVAGMDALSDPPKTFLHLGPISGTIPSPRNLSNAHGPAQQRALRRDRRQKILTHNRSCTGSSQRRVASRVAEPRASDARARGDIDVNTVPDLNKATALVGSFSQIERGEACSMSAIPR